MSAHAFLAFFRAVKILNRYNLSGQMKGARNSDSKTHVKKQNPTSGTEIRQKSLKYLFLETPCTVQVADCRAMSFVFVC